MRRAAAIAWAIVPTVALALALWIIRRGAPR